MKNTLSSGGFIAPVKTKVASADRIQRMLKKKADKKANKKKK